MSYFDDILAQSVTDEADRAVMLKYPQLRQTLDELYVREQKNQNWLEKNWDEADRKTFREKELETALTQANENLAAQAARGNADMTFEEIEANLKTKGYMSKSEVDAQINAAKTEVNQLMSRHDLGAMRLAGEAANFANKYRTEFGEDMNVSGFTSTVATAWTPDQTKPDLGLSSVYDQFVASKRAEKQTRELETLKTTHAAELAAATTRAAEEARRSTLMEVEANGGRGMPVDQGRGAQMGFMQQRSIERTRALDADGNQKVPNGKLGDGSTTAAIMAQLAKDRAEGKLPTAVM